MTKQEFMHENKVLSSPKLLHLDLETSSVCNFNCAICPRPTENGEMDIDTIKMIIDQFAHQGGQTIKPFWRGEPTADKRMPEILKFAKSFGLKTMLNTNGSFPLNNLPQILENTDWISLSIDEDHKNIYAIHHFIDLMIHRRITNPYLYVEVQATKFDALLQYLCDRFDFVYKVDKPTKRKEDDTKSETITGERRYCGFPEWRMVVDYKGNCTLCCVDWKMENNIGNISKGGIEATFNNEKAKKLREDLKNNTYCSEICTTCPSRRSYK